MLFTPSGLWLLLSYMTATLHLNSRNIMKEHTFLTWHRFLKSGEKGFDLCVAWHIQNIRETKQTAKVISCVLACVGREKDCESFRWAEALSREELQPCVKQICNSIKCPSKWRWGVTGGGVEREWECQCRLADRQDGRDVDMFAGLSAGPTEALQGDNWFHSGLNGWKVGEPKGATGLHTSLRTTAHCTQC